MQQQNSGMSCHLGSWALAAGAGLLLFVLLLVVGGWGLIASIFMAGLAFAVLGLAFSWLFCRELPPARGIGNPNVKDTVETTAPAPKAAAPSAPSPNAPPPVVEPAPTASEATSPATAKASPVKASAPLAGEDELASRKGEWKYEGGNNQAAKVAEPSAPPAPAAKADTTPDYDDDGTHEGTGDGSKPETLTEAREGGPDNLKEIKGVGPKLEKLLHSMGFYHFDQIANWTADEEAWVNTNLEGFKGRVSRDEWVKQAKVLAAGGDTEFSKRVDKGDVY
jgi:predicted flap endonuclease-1-like 5' DNA nuclease